MKAIVIGATGATGRPLVEQLLASRNVSEVRVWVRRKAFDEHPKLVQEIIDFDNIAKYTLTINATIAFSCLGTTLKVAGSKDAQWKIDHDYQLEFAKACSKMEVNCFVLLSALGAHSKSSLFYNRLKGNLEEEIKRLGFNSTIIFRPSLLIRPQTKRLGEKVFARVLNFLNLLGLLKNLKPIKTEMLAEAMIKSSGNSTSGISIYTGKEIFDLLKERSQ